MEELIRIGLKCNQNCIFCNTQGKYEPILSEKQAREKISRLSRLKDCEIYFTGGEPTIYDNLINLISFSKKCSKNNGNHIEIGIQTNAVRCSYNSYTKKLVKAGLNKAFVSLHSHRKVLSDFLTRTPGSYEKTIEGIHNLFDNNISVAINIVINSLNYRELEDYTKFIYKQFPETKLISFSFVQPHGYAWKNRWIIPRISDIRPFLIEAMKYCKTNKMKFNIPFCGIPVCFVPEFKEYALELDLLRIGENNDNLKLVQNNKMKGPACRNCKYDMYCFGVWKAYAKIYGFDEFEPIRR